MKQNEEEEEVKKKEIIVDIKVLKRLAEMFPKISYEKVKEILLKNKNDSDSASLELLDLNDTIPDDNVRSIYIARGNFIDFSL